MADDTALLSMFDLPTPPRPTRRARSRSNSLSPSQFNRRLPGDDRVPLFMPVDGSPQSVRSGMAREAEISEAWNGGQSGLASRTTLPAAAAATTEHPNSRPRPRLANQYRDHNPTMSIQRTRDQAMAIFDDLEAEENGMLPSEQQGGGVHTAFDPLAFGLGDGGNGTAKGEGESDAKKRRVMPKIDSTRLLSDNGFPALIKESKRFRVKGKGHEQSDLNSLLSMYQLWAHGMFPKATFKDTVNRIEKVCHQRDMQGKVREWKQEEYESRMMTLRGSRTPPPLDIRDNAGLEEERIRPAAVDDVKGHDEPIRSSNQQEEEEDFDVDAMIALAEAEAEQLQQAGEAIEDLPEEETTTVVVAVRSTLSAGPEDDEEDWAAMDG